jgi:hypothetical protein
MVGSILVLENWCVFILIYHSRARLERFPLILLGCSYLFLKVFLRLVVTCFLLDLQIGQSMQQLRELSYFDS